MAKNTVAYQVATGEETWLTPRYVLEALNGGGARPFDLDPCTPPRQPWPTAKRRFTRKDDGLAQPWPAKALVFMNPPYGRGIGAWMRKLAQQGNGLALVFARTDTAWWHQNVARKALGVFFIEGRLRFCKADGSSDKAAPASSVLIAYGKEALRRLEQVERTQAIKGYLLR